LKAVFFERHGGPEVLRYGDLEDPKPGRGEVLLDVKATSVNHLDMFVRRGAPGIKVALPHIPGCDAAGVVAGLGEDVEGVGVGDRVLVDPSLTCGRCEFCVRGDATLCRTFRVIGEHVPGASAEKLAVPAVNLQKIPDSLSFEDAAAAPMVFVTAWRMMVTRGRLRPGETVLILGAASGVGTACIQIAKLTGATVLAAAGGKDKLKLCRDLGADVLIDYTKEDFVKRARESTAKRGVDVCVDFVGKDTWVKSLRSLAQGGRVLTCGATTGYDPATDLRHIFYRQLEIIGSTMGTHNDLAAAMKFIYEGRMKPVVGKVMDLADTGQAHKMMEDRKVLGKIVIRTSQ
jgi:NADPH:quinone reductase-like Zn-dependent oxidoreductase